MNRTTYKSDHEKKYRALVHRRNQLLGLINQESNRLKQTWDEDAATFAASSLSRRWWASATTRS